jgi:DNA-binding MarR family transcriptional regulator
MSRDKRKTLQKTLGSEVRAWQRSVDAFDEAVAAQLGVNRTDMRCLDVLMERGEATPGQLADAVGLTSGSVTAMLDRVERIGYVHRAPDPSDRRRFVVRPTAKALEACARFYAPIAEDGAHHLARYRIAELDLLIDFVRRDRAMQAAHVDRIRRLEADRG